MNNEHVYYCVDKTFCNFNTDNFLVKNFFAVFDGLLHINARHEMMTNLSKNGCNSPPGHRVS